MNSIEFGKKCRPLNLQYRELFGYVPCRDNYLCSQEEYFEALTNAVLEKKELTSFLTKKEIDYINTTKRY